MAPTTLSAGKKAAQTGGFTLVLENFEGPFDLLLSLIARRKLDITEVALAEVTDEFLSYLQLLPDDGGAATLEQVSDFLVTAATLLDLKAARLLPRGTADTETGTALLEARDLLFARLLQYRAYRDVAAELENRYRQESGCFPRSVLSPQFAKVLPELVFTVGAEDFARIAARVLAQPAGEEERRVTDLDHLVPPLTSIAEQEEVILDRLAASPQLSLAALLSGSEEFEIAVVRLFALLELLNRDLVRVSQHEPRAEVLVSASDLSLEKDSRKGGGTP